MPASLAAALRREDPARVLPLGLATLCAIVCAIGGAPADPDEFLEGWGVITEDEAADRAAARSLQNLHALQTRLHAAHAQQNLRPTPN